MSSTAIDSMLKTPLTADSQTAAIIGWLFFAVAMIALVRGVFVMITRVYRNYDDAEGCEQLISTRQGFAAILHGLHYFVLAALFIVCAMAILRGEVASLIGWAAAHTALLIGLGGVWMALYGLTKTIGDVESRRPGSYLRSVRIFDRLLGLPFLLLGLAIAVAGFADKIPQVMAWLR